MKERIYLGLYRSYPPLQSIQLCGMMLWLINWWTRCALSALHEIMYMRRVDKVQRVHQCYLRKEHLCV